MSEDTEREEARLLKYMIPPEKKSTPQVSADFQSDAPSNAATREEARLAKLWLTDSPPRNTTSPTASPQKEAGHNWTEKKVITVVKKKDPTLAKGSAEKAWLQGETEQEMLARRMREMKREQHLKHKKENPKWKQNQVKEQQRLAEERQAYEKQRAEEKKRREEELQKHEERVKKEEKERQEEGMRWLQEKKAAMREEDRLHSHWLPTSDTTEQNPSQQP